MFGQYLTEHPTRVIESKLRFSEYIISHKQVHGIIISLFKLSQTESNPLIAEINVIYVGHINKLLHVSTVPFNFVPMSAVSNTVLVMSETSSTRSKENDLKNYTNI